MHNPDLREQMIIRKVKKKSLSVSTKSILSFLMIWGLWSLTAYLIAIDHDSLFFRPLLGEWTLWDIFRATLVMVLIQLIALQIWWLYISRQMKRKRRREQTASNHTGR